MLCRHVQRSGSVVEGHRLGGVSMGRCRGQAVPGLVVCAEHATRDALVMLIDDLRAENDRLRAQLKERA